MLWNNSQESWTKFLQRCYIASMDHLKLTKEWQADAVVEVHNAHNGQAKTELGFNPSSPTPELRRKANEAALSRHMSKEDLFELAPYVLGGMSDEAKLAFANQYLAPAGLRVSLAEKEQEEGFGIEAAVDTHLAVCRSAEHVVEAAKNPTQQNLEIADREAGKAVEKWQRMRKLIKGTMKAATATKAAIGRVYHKKEKA